MTRRAQSGARCVICGTTENVGWHHVGGRHHVAWFKMPLCDPHHDQLHALAGNSTFEETSDPVERIVSALQATDILHWMLTESLKYTHRQGAVQ